MSTVATLENNTSLGLICPAPLDRQFLFIIGAPRSGTTWLQTMLAAHPGVATTVELTLFNKYLEQWLTLWAEEAAAIREGRWQQGLPVLWSEEEFHAFLREFLTKVYGGLLAGQPEATHILDKNPDYALHVNKINTLLPQSRFIHIIRDGRDVVCSMLAANKTMGFGASSLQQAAAVWKNHLFAARQASAFAGRYLEVRYEQLLADPADTLRRVMDFAGLSISSDKLAMIADETSFAKMKQDLRSPNRAIKENAAHFRRGKPGGWKTELSPHQKYELDRAVGDVLNNLGYAEPNWWATTTFQKMFLPSLSLLPRIARRLNPLRAMGLRLVRR